MKIKVGFAGNPNVGKTTLFNYLTGLRQHVGNWPGKTVEKAEGHLNFNGDRIDIVDLPGNYALSAHSIEEIVSTNENQVIYKDKIIVMWSLKDVMALQKKFKVGS